ncbi:ABC transporter permease [Kocuria tytonicola]|uniref:ABC transporter permease n=1 Tax=Kocuria tytonicola TaxID=2055946 RepID=UPI000EF8A25B|nr:ABC transporter permease [Kocuria tytonicola]RLZ04484.1 ABC transporter permease [Kocuria tytonicola]
MSLTYTAYDVLRNLRAVSNMFFVAVLPAVLFVLFGVAQGWSSASLPGGNVSAYVMVSMAAYGAITATTGIAGSAAVERLQGWGRQLALTPMGTAGYATTKVTVAMTLAVVPVLVVFTVGLFTNAAMDDLWRWVLSGVLAVVLSSVFALYGLAAGLIFRSDAAVGAASGCLVVLGFFGNVFMPLSGGLLEVARFTPVYGIVGLARYPVTEGTVTTMDGIQTDSVWLLLANTVAWALVFGAAALLAARKATARR